MSDRADEVARDVLQAQRLSITQNLAWLVTALRAYAEEASQQAMSGAEAEQDHLRVYMDEAVAHWKREADRGAAMLAAIRAGLGLPEKFSAQDVLDQVARAVEEVRRDEREACAMIVKTAQEKLKGRWSLDSVYLEQIAAALRARGEGKG